MNVVSAGVSFTIGGNGDPAGYAYLLATGPCEVRIKTRQSWGIDLVGVAQGVDRYPLPGGVEFVTELASSEGIYGWMPSGVTDPTTVHVLIIEH